MLTESARTAVEGLSEERSEVSRLLVWVDLRWEQVESSQGHAGKQATSCTQHLQPVETFKHCTD